MTGHAIDSLVDEHHLRAGLRDLGNQQKVILARWLMLGVKVLILDEPTRGIDVNAKFEIQTVLRNLCDEGFSIIYISSELLEVLEVSDRILVMHEGRIKGVQRADQASQESPLQQAMVLVAVLVDLLRRK